MVNQPLPPPITGKSGICLRQLRLFARPKNGDSHRQRLACGLTIGAAFTFIKPRIPMPAFNRRRCLGLLARATVLPFAAAPFAARADAGLIRIIVAYPPGGVADATARLLADQLAQRLGVSVVVENKAGAGGAIGLGAIAKAVPDGRTFGFASVSPVALLPHLGGKMPFDPQKDLAPAASVLASPVLLLATPANHAPDFSALLERARKEPGSVRWATAGSAALGHVMLEQIKASAKVDITHIPYKGGGQQINDALGGHFEVLSTNAGPAVIGHVRAGRLRALAAGAPARLAALPDTPTLSELGLPEANRFSVFGLFAPAGTPAAVIERMNAAVNAALNEPQTRQKIEAAGNLPTGGSASAFARQIQAESQANARIIKKAGITAGS